MKYDSVAIVYETPRPAIGCRPLKTTGDFMIDARCKTLTGYGAHKISQNGHGATPRESLFHLVESHDASVDDS